MANPDKVRVRPNSVKVADPGVFFVLHTSDNTPFNKALEINLNVISDFGSYSSYLRINQKAIENHIEILMPFGDKNWQQEIGKEVKVHISGKLFDVNGSGQLTGSGEAFGPFNFDHQTAHGGVFSVVIS